MELDLHVTHSSLGILDFTEVQEDGSLWLSLNVSDLTTAMWDADLKWLLLQVEKICLCIFQFLEGGTEWL